MVQAREFLISLPLYNSVGCWLPGQRSQGSPGKDATFSCIFPVFYFHFIQAFGLNEASYITLLEKQKESASTDPQLSISYLLNEMWEEGHHWYRINYFFLSLFYASLCASCVWLQGYGECLYSLFLVMQSSEGSWIMGVYLGLWEKIEQVGGKVVLILAVLNF